MFHSPLHSEKFLHLLCTGSPRGLGCKRRRAQVPRGAATTATCPAATAASCWTWTSMTPATFPSSCHHCTALLHRLFLPSLPSVVAARGCMHHHIIRRLRRRRRPWALLLLIFFKNCGPKRRRFRAFDLRRRRCRHCDLRRPLVKQTASCGTKARAAPAPRLTGQLRSANGLLKGRTRAHQATVGPREATKVGPQREDFLKYGRTWNWRFRLLSFETVFNS